MCEFLKDKIIAAADVHKELRSTREQLTTMRQQLETQRKHNTELKEVRIDIRFDGQFQKCVDGFR